MLPKTEKIFAKVARFPLKPLFEGCYGGYMGKLFGTDGIRGVANVFPMTTDLAMKVGFSTAYIFKRNHRRPKIIIGKDTRLSGYMIENAITSGICSMGVDVLLVGPLPTPGIAFITSSMRADAGIVISASHNPYEYNGIKIFGNDGFKLPDETEKYIEELILSGEIERLPKPSASEIGRARRIDDAQGRYIVYLKNTFPRDLTLEGLKIVIDCAHGAAYRVAPTVFEELGAEVILTGDRPNGKNINRDCGALYPEYMASVVRENGANAGFALDGDADRLILADEKGEILDGDQIMAICAKHLYRAQYAEGQNRCCNDHEQPGFRGGPAQDGRAPHKDAGRRQVRSGTYAPERLQPRGRTVRAHGFSRSRHDRRRYALGPPGACRYASRGAPSVRTQENHGSLPAKACECSGRRQETSINEVPEIVKLQQDLEQRLGEEGRMVIRPSGTEPVIRVMVEGADREIIEEVAYAMASCIEKHMG